jgi:integrase/recombinase XerD
MTLDAARTKSKRARKIFLPKQMQRQLREYVNSLNKQPLHGYLFSTQKQAHFSANTATQHLQRLYARAGIAGATSHSEGAPGLLHLVSEGLVCLC